MSETSKQSAIATRCIHAGDTIDSVTGAVMPPIYTASTYRQRPFGESQDYYYSRTGNPTREALERCVAELESGTQGIAYASGMAAVAGVLDLLDSGSHVLAPRDLYGGSLRLMREVRSRNAGLEFSFLDFTDPATVAAAIRPESRLLWIETPSNPLLRVFDLPALVALARRHELLVAVDNTFATPCLQRPLELGADIVMHSTTKYLGGHSDVIGGINIVRSAELARQLRSLRSAVGSVPGPFDAYLVLRGVKTLAVRMERHASNARELAAWLRKQPRVAQVHYPGLEEHPQHALARRQMQDFGGMLAFELDGAVATFMNALGLFTVGESLGGVESLAGHPATMSHANLSATERAELGISDRLIRLSVGIEELADLREDLRQALAAA